MDQPTLAIVLNPHTRRGACGPFVAPALEALRARGQVNLLETVGDGGDGARIVEMLAATAPRAVVAAGGDGTVRDVATVLRGAGAAIPLAILPLGTANNVARSLGLLSVRQHGAAALERAVAAICDGRVVPLDLGDVDGQCFVGSFAAGMDGSILAARNRWRTRWRLGPSLGGYPLYLLSCAVNLARQRSAAATLRVDGASSAAPIYNLLVTNTAVYAGEFRFDDDDHSRDGRLDLHVFRGPLDYVRAFARAWRRHVRHQRGEQIVPPVALRRFEQLDIESAQPMASQLDGEDCGTRDRFHISVLPAAIRVLVPSN